MLGESLFYMSATNVIVEGCILPGMIAEANSKTISERIGLLKQAFVISSAVTLALDNEITKLVKDYGELKDLADYRF